MPAVALKSFPKACAYLRKIGANCQVPFSAYSAIDLLAINKRSSGRKLIPARPALLVEVA
jgi:hypothetical protein